MTVHVARLVTDVQRVHSLGRHIEHDDDSLHFAFAAPQSLPTKAARWTIEKPVLNQWSYQACVGNGFAQLLNTDWAASLRTKIAKSWFTEGDALSIYAAATHDDGLHDPGQYFPPVDNGSSGLGGAKACQQLGFITAYQHAFSFAAFLHALSTQPVVVGTAWTNTMDDADANGLVDTGSLDDSNIAGGHEYLAIGFDPGTQLIEFVNSWGASWGMAGHFFVSYAQYKPLLALQGDVIVPQLAT